MMVLSPWRVAVADTARTRTPFRRRVESDREVVKKREGRILLLLRVDALGK